MTDKVIKRWKQKIRSMKKEDYIVLLLIGVLLLIISLPTGTGKEEQKNAVLSEEGNAGEREKITELSGSMEGNAQKAAAEAGNFERSGRYDIDSYVEGLETRVEDIISDMEGAGKVQVMITVADMGVEILEKNTEVSTTDLEEMDDAGGSRRNTENGQREEVIYLRDADGNEIPYVVQRKLPEVTGVVVIAEGAGNAKVKENIIGAVGVLFNLNEHRIKVIRMKS